MMFLPEPYHKSKLHTVVIYYLPHLRSSVGIADTIDITRHQQGNCVQYDGQEEGHDYSNGYIF